MSFATKPHPSSLDYVYKWINETLKKLQDSDDAHKYMVYRLLETIDLSKWSKVRPATMAGAIMSIAFDYSPTKDKYYPRSKAWLIMDAMEQAAVYDQIRRFQRKILAVYEDQIVAIRGEFK